MRPFYLRIIHPPLWIYGTLSCAILIGLWSANTLLHQISDLPPATSQSPFSLTDVGLPGNGWLPVSFSDLTRTRATDVVYTQRNLGHFSIYRFSRSTGQYYKVQSFIIPSICNYSMELYGIESVFAQNNVMELCFILGASQLGLACVLNVVHKIPKRDLSLLGDIGWLIDVVVLYMMALYLVIGASVDFTIVIAGVAAGFLLVVIFGSQEPGKSFASGLKSGLGGFFTSFLDTVSCFSNIMSYIRLFAVGMASLAIAQSFNNMAGMAGPVFGAVIAVLGTALNLVMGLLSVVVHGVRLNLLEFSGQLSMEWTGYKYEPFRETVETANETEQGVVK